MRARSRFFVIDKRLVVEFLLVAFVILNSFLPQLHLLIEEDLSTLHFLGKKIAHPFLDNQHFVWTQLSCLQSLLVITIFFFSVKRRFKYGFFFLAYWLLYSMLFYLLVRVTTAQQMMLIKNSCLVFLLLLYLASLRHEGFSFTSNSSFLGLPPLKSDIIFFLLIICLPLLDKLNEHYTPETSELLFMNYKISSGGWQLIPSLFGFIIVKLNLLVPCFVFFFTIKKWWRYAFLFPIMLAIYQLKNGIDPKVEYVDVNEFIEAAPLLLLVLVFLLFLSRSAYYQSKIAQIYSTTTHRIEEMARSRFRRQEDYLKTTKKQLNHLKSTKKTNKEELFRLKHQLEQELQDY